MSFRHYIYVSEKGWIVEKVSRVDGFSGLFMRPSLARRPTSLVLGGGICAGARLHLPQSIRVSIRDYGHLCLLGTNVNVEQSSAGTLHPATECHCEIELRRAEIRT